MKDIHELINTSILFLDSKFVGMKEPDQKPYIIHYRPFEKMDETNFWKQVSFAEVDMEKTGFSGNGKGVMVSWYEQNEYGSWRLKDIVLFDIELLNKFEEVKTRLQNESH